MELRQLVAQAIRFGTLQEFGRSEEEALDALRTQPLYEHYLELADKLMVGLGETKE